MLDKKKKEDRKAIIHMTNVNFQLLRSNYKCIKRILISKRNCCSCRIRTSTTLGHVLLNITSILEC